MLHGGAIRENIIKEKTSQSYGYFLRHGAQNADLNTTFQYIPDLLKGCNYLIDWKMKSVSEFTLKNLLFNDCVHRNVDQEEKLKNLFNFWGHLEMWD